LLVEAVAPRTRKVPVSVPCAELSSRTGSHRLDGWKGASPIDGIGGRVVAGVAVASGEPSGDALDATEAVGDALGDAVSPQAMTTVASPMSSASRFTSLPQMRYAEA